MILALDLATKTTGWAVIEDKETVLNSGIINAEQQDLEDRLIETCNEIEKLLNEYKIKEVICEDVHIGVNKNVGIKLARLSGAVIHLIARYNLPFKFIHNKTIKAVYGGDGNANKKRIIEVTNERFPDIEILSDDHADAIGAGITYLLAPEKAKSL